MVYSDRWLEDGKDVPRCQCKDCEDGKRAPMGWMNKDGSITFTKKYMGKHHVYTIRHGLTDKT